MSESAREPYAVFDLDHTLWGGTLLDYVVPHMTRELGKPMTWDPYAEFFVPAAMRYLREALAEHPPSDIFDNAYPVITENVERRMASFARPLIEAVRSDCLTTVVMSQSPADWVKIAVDTIVGVDVVMGSELVVDDGVFTGEIKPLDKKEGMRVLEQRGYESAPRFAIGDGMPDLAVLQAAVDAGGAAIAVTNMYGMDHTSSPFTLSAAVRAAGLDIPYVSFRGMDVNRFFMATEFFGDEGEIVPFWSLEITEDEFLGLRKPGGYQELLEKIRTEDEVGS